MKEEIVKAMEEFALRVLAGGENVTAQETAILPEILYKMNMHDEQRCFENLDRDKEVYRAPKRWSRNK